MKFFDLHTHTTYSDGENTPEEMVRAAIRLGCPKIGFADHSYVSFDPGYCLSPERYDEYRAEIAGLKEKYRGKIGILLGIEQEYYSEKPAEGFDYVIGSVHYVGCGDARFAVDDTEKIFLDGVNRYFGGDVYSAAEAYFGTVADVPERTGADVIGHFDLIRRFNRDGRLFDETHPRYRAAAKAAIDRLLTYGIPFEINTGAVTRGYLPEPYPSIEWIDYIRGRGGSFLLTGDCHDADLLCRNFAAFADLIGK